MAIKEVQTTIGRLVSFGVAATSLFLTTSGVSDPVNVTKMTLAGGLGIAGLFVFLLFGFKESRAKHSTTLIIVSLFLLAGINALLFSDAPVSQNLYGTYGRNTGFLTYFFMVGVLLATLMFFSEKNFAYLVNGLLFTGAVNALYCAWVLAFGDFIGWTNPYGNILGLFGNPDFISAFLGMFITSSIAMVLNRGMGNVKRLILIILSVLAFFEIIRSHAVQGLVVTAGGLIIIGFYYVYSRSTGWAIPLIYSGISGVLGILAILGTLQKGPFGFVYKRSVSLRGSYWHAGFNMGEQNPLHGVGFDAYGDWYRRSRPPIALVDMPGVNIMSNASHNVVIDFFASGGWPLLLSYVAILILGTNSIIKVTLKYRRYNAIFVSMAATWICYQVQSFISINQIGLTVWGWALTGALISYEKFILQESTLERPARSNRVTSHSSVSSAISPTLVASIGIAIGIFIAAPALNSDITWQNANQSRNLETIKKALLPTFMNPPSSLKYAQAVNIFQKNNLLDLAHQYVMEAVAYNPDYFDAWKQLYYLPNATIAEKNEALSNMKRLDPLNPDVTQIR